MSIFYSRSEKVDFDSIDFNKPTCLPISRKDTIRTHSFLNGWRSVQIKDGTRFNRGSLAKLAYKHYLYEYNDGKPGYRKIKAELVKLMKQNPDEFKKAKTQEEAIAILLGKLQEGNSKTKERIKIKDAPKPDSTPNPEPTPEPTPDPGPSSEAKVPNLAEELAAKAASKGLNASTDSEAKDKLREMGEKLVFLKNQLSDHAKHLDEGSDERAEIDRVIEDLEKARVEQDAVFQSTRAKAEELEKATSAVIDAMDQAENKVRALAAERGEKVHQQMARMSGSEWQQTRAKDSARAKMYHFNLQGLDDFCPRPEAEFSSTLQWLDNSYEWLRPWNVGVSLGESDLQTLASKEENSFKTDDARAFIQEAAGFLHQIRGATGLGAKKMYEAEMDELIALEKSKSFEELEQKASALKQAFRDKVAANKDAIQSTLDYFNEQSGKFGDGSWKDHVNLVRFERALQQLSAYPEEESSLEKLTEWVFLFEKYQAEGMQFTNEHVDHLFEAARMEEQAGKKDFRNAHATSLREKMVKELESGYRELRQDYEEIQEFCKHNSGAMDFFKQQIGSSPIELIGRLEDLRGTESEALRSIEPGTLGEANLLQGKYNGFKQHRNEVLTVHAKVKQLFLTQMLPHVVPADIRVKIAHEFGDHAGSLPTEPFHLLGTFSDKQHEKFVAMFDLEQGTENYDAAVTYAENYYHRRMPPMKERQVQEMILGLEKEFNLSSLVNEAADKDLAQKFSKLPSLPINETATKAQLKGWIDEFEPVIKRLEVTALSRENKLLVMFANHRLNAAFLKIPDGGAS